jgi:hypothetical protein
MTLDAVEFICRFLQHVLPCGFVKIRHYGFLANGVRAARIRLCRSLLPPVPPPPDSLSPEQHRTVRRTCHACGIGRMRVIGIITATTLLTISTVPEVNTS